MTLVFENETECSFDFNPEELAKSVIEACLDSEDFPYECEVNLTLVDDNEIQRINREHREIDKSTDVLSFPLLSYESAGDFSFLDNEDIDNINPDSGEVMLGDIVISTDHVVAQALEYGHSTKREYAFLITHSMLHLFGYDHMTDAEREVMEEKQKNILNEMGITREE